MINYIEKGRYLHKEIRSQGYNIWSIDGVTYSDDDTAVQAIVDTYDPLPAAQEAAKERVRLEASQRVAAIYPFINPEKDEAIGLVQFAIDLYDSIIPAAQDTLPQRLQDVQAIRATVLSKSAEIDALTTYLQCDAYDATIGW